MKGGTPLHRGRQLNGDDQSSVRTRLRIDGTTVPVSHGANDCQAQPEATDPTARWVLSALKRLEQGRHGLRLQDRTAVCYLENGAIVAREDVHLHPPAIGVIANRVFDQIAD